MSPFHFVLSFAGAANLADEPPSPKTTKPPATFERGDMIHSRLQPFLQNETAAMKAAVSFYPKGIEFIAMALFFALCIFHRQ
jgi:hypothetical protein